MDGLTCGCGAAGGGPNWLVLSCQISAPTYMLSKGIFKQISNLSKLVACLPFSLRADWARQSRVCVTFFFLSKSPGISCLSSELIDSYCDSVSPSLIWAGRKWGAVQTGNFERQIRKNLGWPQSVCGPFQSTEWHSLHPGDPEKTFEGNFYSEERSLTYIGAEPARDVSISPLPAPGAHAPFDTICMIMMIAAI
jgi:hypothetical protein